MQSNFVLPMASYHPLLPPSSKKVSSYSSFQPQLSTFRKTYSHVPKMPHRATQSGAFGHAISDSKLLNENRQVIYGERTITGENLLCPGGIKGPTSI